LNLLPMATLLKIVACVSRRHEDACVFVMSQPD
jgi:hypothetical protein